MVVESIQSSFKWNKNEILFHFLWKKTAIWTFEKEQEKHLNLVTVTFKIWKFNTRGSYLTDKKLTFES